MERDIYGRNYYAKCLKNTTEEKTNDIEKPKEEDQPCKTEFFEMISGIQHILAKERSNWNGWDQKVDMSKILFYSY